MLRVTSRETGTHPAVATTRYMWRRVPCEVQGCLSCLSDINTTARRLPLSGVRACPLQAHVHQHAQSRCGQHMPRAKAEAADWAAGGNRIARGGIHELLQTPLPACRGLWHL